MRIRTIETPDLGNRSYLVDDGTVSVVIDPQRDIDRVETLLEDGPGLAGVLETHIHNDYLTGGLQLARRAGAAYGINAADEVDFDRLPLHDDQVLALGTLAIRVLATPGHTDTHLSYLVTDTAAVTQPPVLFSGGSLLYGTVGRTDLVDPARTRELSLAQYRSAHRLGALPGDTVLCPTHGFGSFCAAAPAVARGGQDQSTIAAERGANVALLAADEQSFADELIAGLGAYPAYYAEMAPRNLRGPSLPELGLPEPLTPTALARLLHTGAHVVDLRPGADFAADHLVRTLSIGLGSQFATYVGWLTPYDEPLVVIGETAADLLTARRALARIGREEFEAAWGSLDALAPAVPRRGYRRASFKELATERVAGDLVLDVRRVEEYAAGHLPGAVHLALHELTARLDELPRRRTWVHCAGGFRAGTAASILDAAGREVIHIDDRYDGAVELGLTR
ncbi:MAG: MBL fold metallo-hydrolase [Nocardioides sp.]|uniref:MBL fold metallo-hydrolase n=1 Tax=Nocardioides sp. TaxID=35761 RepID=UPI0039E45A10